MSALTPCLLSLLLPVAAARALRGPAHAAAPVAAARKLVLAFGSYRTVKMRAIHLRQFRS